MFEKKHDIKKATDKNGQDENIRNIFSNHNNYVSEEISYYKRKGRGGVAA